MINFVKSPEYMGEYITNFYANKPIRAHHNGPIPVSFNTQMKTEQIVKEYFNIVQRRLEQVDEDERENVPMVEIRNKLLMNLKTYQTKLNDCIWQTNTPEEAEKCSDDFIKDVVSKGYVFAYEQSKLIKID